MTTTQNFMRSVVPAFALVAFVGCAESGEVCFNDGAEMVEGAAGCVRVSEVEGLKALPLADGTVLSLTHPDDFSRSETVATCAAYDRLSGEGWYAMSSAAMRREAAFERVCAALDAVAAAGKARKSHFDGGVCSEADVASIPAADMPSFGEAAGPATGIAADGPGRWTMETGANDIIIEELAHADFDGDGLGDILCFVHVRAKGGSATHGFLALLTKDAADGPVSLTPL